VQTTKIFVSFKYEILLDDKIEGLVITFVDITVAKKLEEELNKTIEILREHNLNKS